MIPGAHLIRTLILVVLALFMAMPALATPALATDTQTDTEADKRYTIFAITWRGETEVEKGVRAYIKERNLPFDLIIRSAELDRGKIPALIAEAKALKPDLVYTWGTSVTTLTAGKYDAIDPDLNITDIPIVFTMVTFPVRSKVVPERDSSGRNVTGVSHVVPTDTQIKAMRAYMPVDRIAYIYSNEPNSLLQVQQMETLGKELDYRLFKFPAPVDGEGKPRADALPDLVRQAADVDPQFLYLGTDSFIAQNSEQITELAKEYGLATFTPAERMIASSDALYGLFAPYQDVGRLTARKIEQILIDGQDPSSIPIETLQRFSYRIKINVARALDIYPNMSLISYAEIEE